RTVNEITRTSRGKSIIFIDSAGGLLARRFSHRTMDKLEAYLPSSAGSRTSMLLRHLCHALAIQPHFADAFDARENVVDRLAADEDQLGANDSRYEMTRENMSLLLRLSLKSFVETSRLRASQRLHF